MPATPESAQTVAVALGFDFGSRRIGVAIGNGITGNARSLTVLATDDWPALDELIEQWRPQALVVGLPLDADGSDQAITRRARGFMDALEQRFGLPVTAVDERYTTIEADERLRAARAGGRRSRRVARGDADAVAAQVILENWLEQT